MCSCSGPAPGSLLAYLKAHSGLDPSKSKAADLNKDGIIDADEKAQAALSPSATPGTGLLLDVSA